MLKTIYNPQNRTWHGPKYEINKLDKAVGEVLLSELEKNPNEIIQINHDSGYQMSCGEIRKRAIEFYFKLRKLGVKNGDNITIIAQTNDDIPSLVIAIFLLGAVVNTLDTGFTYNEMNYYVLLIKPKIIFCDETLIQNVKKCCKTLIVKILTFSKTTNIFSEDQVESLYDFNQDYSKSVLNFTAPKLGNLSETLAMIMCSSGTTGRPKGICVSHAMILYGQFEWWNLKNGDTIFTTSGMFWITFFSILFHSIRYHAPRVFTSKACTSEIICEILQKYDIKLLFTSPHIIQLIIKYLRSKQICELPHLQHVSTSGSIISANVANEMNTFLTNGVTSSIYGLTEAAAAVSSSHVEYKPQSVGLLYKGMNVKILGTNKELLKRDEIGEVCLKPPFKLMGYINDLHATKSTFTEDGWLLTGDNGYFDKDGYLFLIDRKKDMLLYMNYIVSPAELEHFIENTCEDVSTACVVGIPNDLAGDLPAALIVKQNNSQITETDIYNLIKDNFSDVKKLRGGVYFVDSVPRTNTGKVSKVQAKAMAIERFKQLYAKNVIH